jgi:hypothetical protein
MTPNNRSRRSFWSSVVVALALATALALPAFAAPAPEKAAKPLPTIELEDKAAFPLPKHLEQSDIAAGKASHQQLFEAGEMLFHTEFNGLDGVGMLRTVGGAPLHRFSIGPAGGGQPIAVGAQSCGACHNTPFGATAGPASNNVLFDFDQDGKAPFNPRNATSLFGNGLLQLAAQEMTEELQAARDKVVANAKQSPGQKAEGKLAAKGVEFGTIGATADAAGQVAIDLSRVSGVDPDLVVRPFGWKGTIANLRNFQVAPATFGMGMMAEEFVWRLPESAGADPDGDGVTRELSVGDITAMTIYNALQETPQSVERLAALGLVTKPDAASLAKIARGRAVFAKIGCTSCHRPEMRLANTVYEEPTKRGNGHYLDHFLVGKSADYDPAKAVKVDLLAGAQAPRAEAANGGGATLLLYGDLKRHDMGRTLAEPAGGQAPFQSTLAPLKQGEQTVVVPASVFLTPELWGVGNTGPWLHDGRAGSLAEAITLHGEDAPPPPGSAGRSEAQEARDAFVALDADDKAALTTFLKSLVTFSANDPEL